MVVNASPEDKVEKMYTDMYVGEGKDNPSMTTRMAMVEDKVDRVEDKIDRQGKNVNKALWLVVATLLGLGGEIVLRFVVK